MKRTPLRPISLKRSRELRARKAAIREVIERDGERCEFARRHDGWLRVLSGDIGPNVPECGGPLDAHEPDKRSQGADSTNPSDIVLICRNHHDYIHQNPRAGYRLALLNSKKGFE